MDFIKSFPPIANPTASILILGSIPGNVSIKANQYYAHPRNAFWSILGAIFDFDSQMLYQARVNAVKASNIAIWDVLQQCERQGSLDSRIKTGSRSPNDFNVFFKQHPQIRLILFNGAEAEKSFKKYVAPKQKLSNHQQIRLPSTSPAHTIPFAQKMSAWQAAFKPKFSD